MKKKKSPVVEMTGHILDEIQEHNDLVRAHKKSFVNLLKKVEWNLVQSGSFNYPNSAQALGLVRGALMMFGENPQ